ncbi:uncharacterized protein LOC127723138 [Mytilus californianus]|uniref:uncharacterized protein LOC127723138 n=1 Tax=Mytilus californianus TaxID=6549 RepID=UPI00224753CE|nr:uncharacterized protein LOC127723138 [Mytilus californianus]
MALTVLFLFLLISLPVYPFSIVARLSNQTLGNYITDAHYNVVLDLFNLERQARLNLEKYVIRLNERLSEMEKDSERTQSKLNNIMSSQVKQEWKEEVTLLKNQTDAISETCGQLFIDYKNLKKDFNIIKQQTQKLQNEVVDLKYLKSVAQLQNVDTLNNVTKRLEKEIQHTNDNIELLVSDSNTAHKKDFTALVNNAAQMRKETADIETRLCKRFSELQNSTISSLGILNTDVNLRMQNFSTLLKELENKVENRSDLNIASQSKRVALTACGGGIYSNGDTAKFSQIKENHGINSLDSFKQSGKFTCEVAGMYLFFASLISDSNDVYFRWYKNSRSQSGVYISERPPSYESGSGMLAVKLGVGDTVSLKCERSNILIDGFSCFTFFKMY